MEENAFSVRFQQDVNEEANDADLNKESLNDEQYCTELLRLKNTSQKTFRSFRHLE